MENEVQSKSIPILRILKTKILWIVLIAVIFVIGGFCYGKFIAKPVYTASCNVIVKVRYSYPKTDEHGNELHDASGNVIMTSNTLNDFALAQRTLPTIVSTIKSPDVIEQAKTYHNDNGINRGSFNATYDKNSLLFTVSYSDYDPDLAKGRLEDVFEASKKYIAERKVTTFSDIEFVKTQNKINVFGSGATKRYVLISGAIGFLFAVLLFVLIYLFDNKVKTVNELEDLTGADVLATISE